MKQEHDNDVETPREAIDSNTPASSEPPKNSRIMFSFIIILLMGLALTLGVVAGPLIINFFEQGLVNDGATDSAASGHNHGATGTVQKTADEESSWYVCTMHPWVVQPGPGKCPICSMDLTPLDPDRFSGEIAIDPVVLQNIGVRVKPVVVSSLEKKIRTVGTVTYDETRVVDVNLKVSGWVENIDVDFLGAEVRKGQPLLEIYAPDLYATQDEYILLWKNRNTPGNEQLLQAARNRLAFYDISDEQISALEKSGKAKKTMVIRAPANGVVIEKNVNAGVKVSPGSRLYRIADLRKVWVLATFYEHQLPFIKLNQHVEMSLPYEPGKKLEGKISYIYPFVDEKTREVQVRLEFANPGGLLKPGMFANVEVVSDLSRGERVLAPREAVIDTGLRKVAFVSLGNGKFEPRTVATGLEAGDGQIEILNGLAPGEQVVVSGQFLLDSESRIRESLAKMIKGNLATEKLPEAEFPASKEIVALPAGAQEGLSGAIKAYLSMQDDLYNGSIEKLSEGANQFSAQLVKAVAQPPQNNPHFWHEREEIATLQSHAKQLETAKDIQQIKIHFGYLGEAFNKLLRYTGIPESYKGEVIGVHCGMFEAAPEGGIWLQTPGNPRNPFFGSDSPMKSCGSEQWTLPMAGATGSAVEKVADHPQSMDDMDHSEHTDPIAGNVASDKGDIEALQKEESFKQLLETYLEVHQELYQDSLDRLPELAKVIQHAGMKMGHSEEIDAIHNAAAELAKAADLESARVAFGKLGFEVNKLLQKEGPPASLTTVIEGRRCGMFTQAPEGGVWIQAKGEGQNPFFGANSPMASCAPGQWDYSSHK